MQTPEKAGLGQEIWHYLRSHQHYSYIIETFFHLQIVKTAASQSAVHSMKLRLAF